MLQPVPAGRPHRRVRVPPSDPNERPFVGDPHAEYRARRSRKIVKEFAIFAIALSTVAGVAFVVFWSLGLLGEVQWEESENSASSSVIFPTTMKQWNHHIQATNHSVVLAIYSEGCPSCKRMKAPYMKAARTLAERAVTFVAINANKREFAPLVHEYGVEVVPTILFLDTRRTIFPYPGGANAKKIQEFVVANLDKAVKH